MTDGVILNPGSGGQTVDTEISPVTNKHMQRIKMVLGPVDTDASDVSATNPLPVTTVVQGTSTDRGTIIGFSGAVGGTGGASSTTLTVATAPTAGTIQVGHVIAGVAVAALGTGTGGAGTYTMASAINLATGTALTSVGPQQIMAANAARRGVQYQNQNASANIWTNGTGAATADFHSIKLVPGAYYESPPTHTGVAAIAAISDTPGATLYAREY